MLTGFVNRIRNIGFTTFCRHRELLFNNSSNIFHPVRVIADKTLAEDETEQTKKAKKKKVFISLIGTDNNHSYMTLEEATKLSNRRGLKLIKITDYDSKKECAVYRIMTGAQYLEEDIISKKSKQSKTNKDNKGEKLVVMSNKITDHDLSSKIKQMLKWIDKNYEIRVTISGSEPNTEISEAIFTKIQDAVKDISRILQKRANGSDIKFQIAKNKEAKEKTESSSTKSSIETTS